ncbi:phosphoesterase/phosphatase [Chondromyces crocatus]|uniref:Phosphoesterase/phosphatase n=1 Tax=Chondromyces crocatus TaxID=52 RepID=A0A0K1E6Q2_CHOCO|nr:phosphoesterase/phosphatase [Chondromyces crocatus]
MVQEVGAPTSVNPRAIRLRRFAGPATYLDQLAPLRIAHLTDQHVGRVTPMKVQREAVDLTNQQRPDLVMLTGDFVCHSQLYLDQLEELIRSFDAPVFAVLGNHDHWSGGDEVKRSLQRAGAEVLCNAHTVVTVRHQRLQVVGLDDAYTGHAQRERAVKGLRNDLPSIGLSHIAEEADGLWRHGVPLVLSGHTHAGQVTVARLHELSIGKLAGHKYVHGLYGTRSPAGPQQGAVYVGAGIGASVIPLRLGDRGQREVAVFELGAAPGSFEEHHTEQPALKGRKPSPVVQAKRAEQVVRKREKRERKQRPPS